MYKALLVEDSKEIFTMVNQSISSIIELEWAQTIDEAHRMISNTKKDFSLFLLDIELPDGNGIELCSKLQYSYPQVPVFFITSHTDLSEKVLGFSAGAEDFITKPFLPLELKARVEAKLRRLEAMRHASDVMKWKELTINKNRQEVSVPNGRGDFKKVDLTAIEFKLLLLLASQPHSVVSRDSVLSNIWGEDVHVYSRSVDTHISKLKRKLGEVASVIESVHGVGYKFNPSETQREY